MTRARALKLAKKKFGAKAYVEDRGTKFDYSDAVRAESLAKANAIGERVPMIPETVDFPDDATIGDYRNARAHVVALRDDWRLLRHRAFAKRYVVGYVSGIGRFIQGEGRTLEDALRAANVGLPE